jgi:hypothetical protein
VLVSAGLNSAELTILIVFTREDEMNWIEIWLQVSPDGGDGTFEMLLMLAAAGGGGALLLVINRRARMLLRSLIAPRPAKTPTAHRA